MWKSTVQGLIITRPSISELLHLLLYHLHGFVIVAIRGVRAFCNIEVRYLALVEFPLHFQQLFEAVSGFCLQVEVEVCVV